LAERLGRFALRYWQARTFQTPSPKIDYDEGADPSVLRSSAHSQKGYFSA